MPQDAFDTVTRARRLFRHRESGTVLPVPPMADSPADMATATTDAGVTTDYVVRIERGTMDRGIHEIAVLSDPSIQQLLLFRQLVHIVRHRENVACRTKTMNGLR